MVFKGYKRPLVQEDMWDLNEKDSTNLICEQFEDIMSKELKKACSVLQKKRNKRKTNDDRQNGLAKGVSQDVLVMVRESVSVVLEKFVFTALCITANYQCWFTLHRLEKKDL